MSIKAELEAATGVVAKRGEGADEYLQRLCDKVAELSDNDWSKISQPAKDFFNSFCDAVNNNTEFPKLPEAAPAPVTRSRGANPAAAAPAAPEQGGVFQPGDVVIVTNKRNKVFEGEFVEFDGDTAIVNVEGEEMEFTADRTASMVLRDIPAASGKPEVGEEAEPQPGDAVTLTTKRNVVVTGVVLEIDDTVVVLEIDGKEAEYQRERVTSIVVSVPAQVEDAVAGDETPQVGDTVQAVTKRNKEVVGEVAELDGNVLVVKVAGGGEIDVDMDTAKSVKVVKGSAKGEAPAAPAAAPATGRRTDAPAAPAVPEKKSKVTNADNNGVSVTTRMREILCADPEMAVKELEVQLKKEGLTYKDATLQIVFKDVTKVISLLKANKHFKA